MFLFIAKGMAEGSPRALARYSTDSGDSAAAGTVRHEYIECIPGSLIIHASECMTLNYSKEEKWTQMIPAY